MTIAACVSREPTANAPNRTPSSVAYDPALHAQAVWALDPKIHGTDLPEKGRSVFDHLITVKEGDRYVADIPFPFTKLLEKINGLLLPTTGEVVGVNSGILGVLFPRGRSLQRNTEFHAPRTVIAVVGDPKQENGSLGLMMRNRLYVGFSEQTGILEVISYNEDAARYEYQIVRDYLPGRKAQVFYASRTTCLQCHQNTAPLFALPPWDESNAFPEVANKIATDMQKFSVPNPSPDRLVTKQVRDESGNVSNEMFYFGVPIRVPDAMPYAMDQSTDEANLLGVYNKVWMEGCEGSATLAGFGPTCRGQMLKFGLRYMLAKQLDSRLPDYRDWLGKSVSIWKRQFPKGLKIPNPDIPNRNPFRDVTDNKDGRVFELTGRVLPQKETNTIKESMIPIQFEPLVERDPTMVWIADENDIIDINASVMGISSFFTRADQVILDSTLFEKGKTVERKTYAATCRAITERDGSDPGTKSIKFNCDQPTPGQSQAVLGGTIQVSGEMVTGGYPVFSAGSAFADCSLDDKRIRSNPSTCRPAVRGTLRDTGNVWSLTLQPFDQTSGMHARLSDGNSVEKIELTWPKGQGAGAVVRVTVMQDFQFLERAIQGLIDESTSGPNGSLAQQPIVRNQILPRVLRRLGVKAEPFDCCGDARTARTEDTLTKEQIEAIAAQSPELKPFFKNCFGCHGNGIGHPANWMFGASAARLNGQIRECAERLYYRVSQWEDGVTSKNRLGEMRPSGSVRNRAAWDADRRVILDHLAKIIGEKKGRTNSTRAEANASVLSVDYSSHAPCRTVTEQ